VCATVSIGLVHCKDAVLDEPQLLAQADQALYFAKERGRNRVEIASLDLALQSAGSQPVEPRFKRAAKSAAA
jgi:predicted signal transduction protein with EAL and GGDEF domain